MLRSVILGLLAASAVPGQADPRSTYVELDYDTVDRSIKKEPAYVATPLYAMFVFDLAAKHRVWCALDKSAEELEYYDVLYIDLDGDGDLTEAGERFAGTYDEKLAKAGMGLTIRVGDIVVPDPEGGPPALTHRKFLVSTIRKSGRNGIWFRMQWNGKHEMSGGYGAVGSDTTAWRKSPATAPIIRPCPFGPLSFATWGSSEIVLHPGQETHVNVIAGNAGSGPDTLAVVDDEFLDLERDELLVTVIAHDDDGKEVTATSRIAAHC